MPPKKKKQRLNPEDEELNKLVRWLSREQLEGLVKESVASGSLPIDTLWNTVPESAAAEIRRSRSKVSVSKGSERVGTGYFDLLDQDIVSHIFSYTTLPTKITCVTAVCKAWRVYKATIPGLFTDLSEKLGDGDSVSDGEARMYGRVSFAQALLDWVPDPAQVEAFRIAMCKSCDPRQCNAVLKRLYEIKIQVEKQGKVFRLKKLVLQGAKFSPDVIKRISKQELSKSLTSLVFDSVNSSKKLGKQEAIPNLLETCPMMEQLVIPQSLLLERDLMAHLRSLSSARSGAPLLLTTLDLSGAQSWNSHGLNWNVLSKLGEHLPALQVLKIEKLSSGTPVQPAPTSPIFEPANPPLNEFLKDAFAPMPHLKVFSLKQITHPFGYHDSDIYPRYATTPYVTKILTRLFDAMPNVEDFLFGHGSHGYISKKKARDAIIPQLPQLDLSMVSLPPQLKRLWLSEVLIDPNQFILHTNFQRLEYFCFFKCGEAMVNAAPMIHEQVLPHLSLYRRYNAFGYTQICFTAVPVWLRYYYRSEEQVKWELIKAPKAANANVRRECPCRSYIGGACCLLCTRLID